MFLLKAVSGGDPASGRRRDIEDMWKYAQRGLDYELILTEIDEQRPFNTSTTEARQIRDRSHPLFTIEMAVNSPSGLPNKFTTRITEFATEFEVEYTVLGAVDDGIDNVEVLRDRVLANVRALSTTRKTPSMKRLIDWSQSRFSSATEIQFDAGEQVLRV